MSTREADTMEQKEQSTSQPVRGNGAGSSEFISLLGELSEPFRPGMAGRGRGVQRAVQLRRRYGAEGFRNLLQQAWTLRKARRRAAGTGARQFAVTPQAAAPKAATAGPSAKGGRPSVLRLGTSFPSKVFIQNAQIDDAAVEALVYDAAYASAGGHANRANFGPKIRMFNTISRATNLALPYYKFSFTETSGINMNWDVFVSFSMGSPTLVNAGGTGAVQSTSGGSSAAANQESSSTTDSAKVTGGVKAGDAKEGGEASLGGEAGTSTTKGTQSTKTDTANQGGTATVNQELERYKATLFAYVNVDGSADFSGSDYVNPFKWGFAGADAVLANGPKSREGTVGNFEYLKLGGFAPAQKKSWLEHELGAPIGSSEEAQKMNGLAAIDTREFSRDGAQRLPAPAAAAAEQHHGVGMEGVRLVQGAQADAYCDRMDAAAFTTPSNDGHTDIYLHSGVGLDTPAGQHTLQHEIAHAVQNQKGETESLSGLGGDGGKREQLERSADTHATEVLTQSPVQRKETGSDDSER
jgi:hypothetical protein